MKKKHFHRYQQILKPSTDSIKKTNNIEIIHIFNWYKARKTSENSIYINKRHSKHA